MSLQRLGRLGCIWPTDKALQWFEAFYLIKFYICNPGLSKDYHFLSLDSDEDRNLTQDELFKPRDGKCAPYGLVILVFNGSHYENTINLYNKDTPFFHVGERLPDLVYQMCQITPAVWMSLSLLKTSNHNQDVISSIGSRNRFIDLHKEVKYPIYNKGDLDKIVKIEIHEETEKIYTKRKRTSTKEKKLSPVSMSLYESSIPGCEISVQASFLALKIFEYAHTGEEYFGDRIRNMNENNDCCKDKFVNSKDFLISLFYDLNTVYYESYSNYT